MRFSILLLCCLLVTACSLFVERSDRPPSQTQSPPAHATLDIELNTSVITITLAVPEAELAGYQQLIEQFQNQYSHTRVRLVAESEIISSDELNRIAALAVTADVFAYSPTIHENHQYLLDLRPLLNADLAFDANDFLPGLLDDGDSLWSLPVATSYPLLFFDKTAFDAAGLAYPEPGWTLDEFLTAAQALTLREGNEVVQWGYVPFQVQPLLATQLAAPLVVDGEPRLTDPDVTDALQWLADLFILHEVSPWLENYKPVTLREAGGGPDPISLVREGRAAMWSADHSVWQFGFDDENIGLATIPRSPQGYAADTIRYDLAISRGTAQPQAAWILLTFLSQQPPVHSVIDLLVPARRSVAAADGFWERVPAVMVEPLQYAVNNSVASRLTPTLVDSMRGALTAVVTNHQSITDALAQAQTAATGRPVVTEGNLPLVAATPPGGPTIDAEAVPEITFVADWNEMEAQRRLATTFNASQTDVKVTICRIDTGNPLEKIAGVDCFTDGVGRVIGSRHKQVLPLDALFDLDIELSPGDFHPATLSALTEEGQLWGIPAWISVPLIEYNRALFAVVGVAEPSPTWTMADFLDTARTLTNPTAEQYGFVDWANVFALYHSVSLFGINLIGEQDGMATIDFAAAAPIVRWYADLFRVQGIQHILPGDLVPWRDYYDRHEVFVYLVQNSQVAMWLFEPSSQDLARAIRLANIETGLSPFPLGPDGHSFHAANVLTAYFIAADTTYPHLCWQWIKFLSTQPTASASGLPGHLATAESAAFADHVGTKYATAALEAMDNIGSDQGGRIPYGNYSWLQPGFIWLTALMERATKEEIDIDNALIDLVERFGRYQTCVIELQAFEDAAAWRACALEADPDLRRRYN
jgi:ABC-type glycerol-3-phosphate transport system substrate-binding protein